MRIEATVKLAIRPVRTLIALGIKPSVSLKTSLDPRVVLMMCTASNRSGIKFNLSSNIRRIDDRFLNRGKCTIELINPVKTIFISEADPLLLKLLLRTLRKVLSDSHWVTPRFCHSGLTCSISVHKRNSAMENLCNSTRTLEIRCCSFSCLATAFWLWSTVNFLK